MTSFLTVIATPAITQASEKPFFGKPYVRISRLFSIIGYWVYQQGGVLGYAIGDYPSLLGKLAAPPEVTNSNYTGLTERFKGVSEQIASDLEEVKNQEKNFLYLYTVRELRNIGIELVKWPPDKSLDKKVSAEFAGNVMRISFIQGIALGINFPEQFLLYWNNTYRVRPDSELKELRNRLPGLILPEKQEKRTLKQAIVEMAENAILWDNNQSANMLDASDIGILEAIIEMNRNE